MKNLNTESVVRSMRTIAGTYHVLRDIQYEQELRKEDLTVADYEECKRLMSLLGAPGNKAETIYEKAAAFFKRHGFNVMENGGIGYQITV